jgi:rod shape-determining protein MreC
VKLFSDRGPIDYVRVLLFQNFAQLINPEALNAPPLAGLSTAPEPTPQQAAEIADVAARRRAEAEAQAERARIAAAQVAQAQAARQAAAQPPAASTPQARPPAASPPPQPAQSAPEDVT